MPHARGASTRRSVGRGHRPTEMWCSSRQAGWCWPFGDAASSPRTARWTPRRLGRGHAAYNTSSPDEVDTVLAQAEAAGARIGRAGAPTFWGGYSGVFVDPDGHPWEVAHNPGWLLGPDGSVHLP